MIAIPLPKDIPWAEEPDLNATITKLSSIFHNVGDKITYTYDFGDDWIHDIVLEKITDEELNKVYLLKTKGATPLEDNCHFKVLYLHGKLFVVMSFANSNRV